MEEWEKALADARQRGSLFAISGINMWRGYTHLYRGELAEAEASLRTAYDEFQRWQYGGNANSYCAGFLALTRLARGDVEGAWRDLALGEDPGDHSDGARFWWEARTALLSASGRNEEALAATEKLENEFFVGTANPAVSRWRTHRAEVLDRLGRTRRGARGRWRTRSRAPSAGARRGRSARRCGCAARCAARRESTT